MQGWYLLPIVALLNFVVGFSVLRHDSRASVNRAFAACAFSIGGWVLAVFLLTQAWNGQSAIFFESTAHFMGVLIGATFWILVRVLKQGRIEKGQWVFVGLPTILISVMTFWPGLLADKTILYPWGQEVLIKPSYHFAFIVFFSIFFFWGLILLGKQARCGRRRVARCQARCIFRGIACAAVGGIFFDIILLSPFIRQYQLSWIGPIFTIFFVLGSWHAQRRYFLGIPKAEDVVILIEELPESYRQNLYRVFNTIKFRIFPGLKKSSAST